MADSDPLTSNSPTSPGATPLLIMIATYNEVENVPIIVERIHALEMDADVLFVDDHSPDGTGALLTRMAGSDPRLHVLHRPGKMGVGSAHLDGIAWAYERAYGTLITMDCDQTHDPADIPRFLEAAEGGASVVVGSRFLEPHGLDEWVLVRKIITHTGHRMTRHLLGIPFDATGAFRLYLLDRVPRALFAMVERGDYGFFYESLFRLHVNNVAIAEVPIVLPARTYGHSKMRPMDIVAGVAFLIRLAARRILDPAALELDTADAPAVDAAARREAWDSYWKRGSKDTKGVYDRIAAFYRRRIFRPALNQVLVRWAAPGARLLHAGSGGGAVDEDMARVHRIDALDISEAALAEYGCHHPGPTRRVLGDLLDSPFADNTYDGIFNLGVMEHFTEAEIARILCEFNRILKPGAPLVLFWPPAWGLSVMVLGAAHVFLRRVLGSDRRLHPVEHTLVTSRARIDRLLAQSGLRLREFRFGIRDVFTHQVIVAVKVRHVDDGEGD